MFKNVITCTSVLSTTDALDNVVEQWSATHTTLSRSHSVLSLSRAETFCPAYSGPFCLQLYGHSVLHSEWHIHPINHVQLLHVGLCAGHIVEHLFAGHIGRVSLQMCIGEHHLGASRAR